MQISKKRPHPLDPLSPKSGITEITLHGTVPETVTIKQLIDL